jgi:hypothetical protein
MPSIDRLPMNAVLSSDWTGLSPFLLASFYPVRKSDDRTNERWERVPESLEVRAPLTEGQIEQTQNWVSQFEQSGVDARLSNLSGVLQTGSFSAILNALGQRFEKDSLPASVLREAESGVEKLSGLSGVTKLSSTQIYTGSPPLKLTFTAHFRALFDPLEEVEKPLQTLIGWAMPKKLAQDGVLANVVRNGAAVRSVYASEMPQIIGIQYARKSFRPMVVESISTPLTVPLDRNGRCIHTQVQMTVASLTALDRDDWIALGS